MYRIVLDMQCTMFAEAISQSLSGSDPDFIVQRSESPDQTLSLCRSVLAHALIMEVTGSSPWRLSERLQLCRKLRQSIPQCKVLLLVDENANADLAVSVKQAKKDGLIDNFIYASVSPSYLAAVLDTL